MGYASLKEDLLKLYTKEFTEEDLKDMTTFYQSKAGKNLVKKMPLLTKKSMELGAKRVQENMGELDLNLIGDYFKLFKKEKDWEDILKRHHASFR